MATDKPDAARAIPPIDEARHEIWQEIIGPQALAFPASEAALRGRLENSRPVVRRVMPRRTEIRVLILSCAGNVGDIVSVAITPYTVFRPYRFIASDSFARQGHGTLITDIFVWSQLQGEGIPTHAFARETPSEIAAAITKARTSGDAEVASALTKYLVRMLDRDDAAEMAWLEAVYNNPDMTAEEKNRAATRMVLLDAEMDRAMEERIPRGTKPDFTWTTCQPGIPITMRVEFLHKCAWEGQLWGDTLP